MILKNKIKMYLMATISSALVALAGLGCCFAGIGIYDKVTKEVAQTPAYTEYYNQKVEGYFQELKEEKITKNQFDEYTKEIDVDGYIKQLPGAERAEIDKKLQPVDDLAIPGIAFGFIGSGIFGVSLILSHLKKSEIDEENEM